MGIIFLAFGIFVSVSVPSLYHILAFIPGCYFTYKYLRSGYKLPKSAYPLMGLILTGYISNFVNLDGLNDVIRSFGKQKYFIFGILMIFPLKAFLKNYIDVRQIKIILNIFFFTLIASAIFGILKYRYDFNLLKMSHEFTEQYRNGGFTGIMRYGYGMGFVMTFMVGMILYKEQLTSVLPKKWFYTAFLIGGIGFILSFTRGAILGFVCSLPFILWFYKKKLGVLSFIAVSLLISGVAIIAIRGGSESSRFLTKLTKSTNLKRLSQYEASFLAFKEKPILGQGVNQFSSECVRIKDKHQIFWQDYCKRIGFTCEYKRYPNNAHYCGHSHNIFLEIMANMGLIGFIFFILWLGTWTFELIQRNDLLGKLYLPFIINFIVASQFEMVFDANNSFMIFFLYPLSFLSVEDIGSSVRGLKKI